MKSKSISKKPCQRALAILMIVVVMILLAGGYLTFSHQYESAITYGKFSGHGNVILTGPAVIGIGILVLILGLISLRELKRKKK